MGDLGQKLRVLKTDGASEAAARINDIAPPPDISEWYNTTDMGNARRLVAQHGQDLHYCGLWGKWLVWDGQRWIKDDTEEVYRRAKATVLRIYTEASKTLDEERRKSLSAWAVRSESEARIKSMINLARNEPGIPVLPAELDADPWLLNVDNGTLDLRAKELRKHQREDLITKLIPVEFDPGAECPNWDGFLNAIMRKNQEMIDFLQRAVGYALTGDISEQVLFFLHGSGSNGKSTFLHVISKLVADYGLQTPTETLMAKKSESIPNDVARLKGSRFVSAVETEEGRRLAEVLVKQLTGGDTITARFLHQEFFEFKPTFKLFLAANHKPVIRGTDNAIWRRIRLIPFAVTIPEDERDRQLAEKLSNELPGILYWALAGCADWQANGLGMPDEVRAAIAGYREEMDVLAGFLDECCLVAPYAKILVRDVYSTYVAWCEANKERPLNQRRFGMQLTERGFSRLRGTGNRHYWEGIGLVDAGRNDDGRAGSGEK
ncbi:MAG: DNA primase family protein [Candidatus Desulforudaceae bacterium]|nr:phage/plasmid primase, P4 family [Clostridia bacterium]